MPSPQYNFQKAYMAVLFNIAGFNYCHGCYIAERKIVGIAFHVNYLQPVACAFSVVSLAEVCATCLEVSLVVACH